MRTDPSGCCPCSSSATSVRPIGRAELLSVAAKPRFPSFVLVRMAARRAWKVPKSDAEAISR